MKIEIQTEEHTREIARKLAHISQPGDVIALYGDLGVGKSCFARAFIRALTSEDEEVPSPTFTLVQMYDTDETTLFHFDMYRLEKPDDCLEIGVEEAFADGICLIEWPDKIGNYLPWDALKLEIGHGQTGETSRFMQIEPPQQWQARLKEIGFE